MTKDYSSKSYIVQCKLFFHAITREVCCRARGWCVHREGSARREGRKDDSLTREKLSSFFQETKPATILEASLWFNGGI